MTWSKPVSDKSAADPEERRAEDNFASSDLINASGHKQELDRNFSLLNLCGIGITTGNSWTAIGGSVVCQATFYE